MGWFRTTSRSHRKLIHKRKTCISIKSAGSYMRLTAKVVGAQHWAVHSRMPFGSHPQLPPIGCKLNPNPAGRTDHHSLVTYDSPLQTPVQQSTKSYRRYAALENTAWDYHPAFSLMQFLFVKSAAQEDFNYSKYFFLIIIIIITGQNPELPCFIVGRKQGTSYFEKTG